MNITINTIFKFKSTYYKKDLDIRRLKYFNKAILRKININYEDEENLLSYINDDNSTSIY